ncbi:MAG: cytochrome P450 [Acidobacteriota bacterium]
MSPPSRQTARSPGTFFLGNLAGYRQDPLQLFLESALASPDIVRFRMAHLPLFLVIEPRYITHVLQEHQRNYVKGVSYESLRRLLGDGLLTAEGDLWRRQRRLIQPAFLKETLTGKLDILARCVERVIARFHERAGGPPFDLVPEMMRLAFDAVGRTVLGIDIAHEADDLEQMFAAASQLVYERMQSVVKLPEWWPIGRIRRFHWLRRQLDVLVVRVIERHRHEGEGGRTLLSLLMAARDPDTGQDMTDTQLRDELLSFLGAGYETTGDGLCWIFYLLSSAPEVQARLEAEVDAHLGDEAPGAAELAKLTYAGQVIDESWRLYPPAWAFTRSAVAADEIDGHEIPKHAIVVLSPYVNHHHPRFWPDPERFDPDRFAPLRQIPGFAYFPFGGGPHMCVGKHLSLFEVKMALAMLTRRFRVRLVPGQSIRPAPGIALRPVPRMMVTIEARS